MSQPTLNESPLVAGHSPDQERPLGGYAALELSFFTLASGFGLWLKKTGRELPDQIANRDLALATVATFKASRLITRDRVTSTIRAPFSRFQGDAGHGEVNEAARGRGLRRALGELLVCPYCLDMWVASGFLGGLVTAPRATRLIASIFAVVSGADALQLAYGKAESLV
jgi:Protein of unknown function (DUF1360)